MNPIHDTTNHKPNTMTSNKIKSNLNRRQFIRTGAAALAGAAMVPTAVSDKPAVRKENASEDFLQRSPGFYRFSLDKTEITVFSDGSFRLPSDILAVNAEHKKREEFFRLRMIPSDEFALQASPVLIKTENHRVLVDTGSGFSGQEDATNGRLGMALQAAGVSPESIDVVILTHAHPDHLGGLVHPETQGPIFPNAEIVISDRELDLWSGDDAASRFPEWAHPFLPGIQSVLEAMDGRFRTVRDGEEIVSGIRSVASPGHTQGHMAIVLEAGDRELLFVGDSITNIHIDFEHPDWHLAFDLEPEIASRTRKHLLDMAATDGMLILGYHFPFPGLGYALQRGSAWQWYPAGWTVLP
jgi:glyoxylase-like metal-dependent hydrolase (beta-lactamase superfamily II)